MTTLAAYGQTTSSPPVIFTKNARILFQGDSITDGGRDQSGQYKGRAMGHGYAYIIAGNCGGHFPELNLTFLNRGISGNTVADLAARWQKDTIALKPDILSILIGVNDVSGILKAGKEMPCAEIEATYDRIITNALASLPGVKIVLCEPFILPGSANKTQWAEWTGAIRMVQQIVAKLGQKHRIPVVHFQNIFNQAVERAPAEYWLFDGVHPYHPGHQLMADEWIRTVKEAWPEPSAN